MRSIAINRAKLERALGLAAAVAEELRGLVQDRAAKEEAAAARATEVARCAQEREERVQ